MSIQTIRDAVDEAIEKAMKEKGFDPEKWSHDIICFNETVSLLSWAYSLTLREIGK